MKNIIGVLQIVVSVLLIVVIILQQRGSGIGGAFGGGAESVYHSRRGLDKFLHKITIILSILFFILSIAIFLVD